MLQINAIKKPLSIYIYTYNVFVVFPTRLEEKAEHFESALAIVQRGLQEIPRYGPLWFGAFRLSEKLGELILCSWDTHVRYILR